MAAAKELIRDHGSPAVPAIVSSNGSRRNSSISLVIFVFFVYCASDGGPEIGSRVRRTGIKCAVILY